MTTRGALAVLVVALAPASSFAQCTKDSECKGDRVCENGSCTLAPSQTVAPQPALAPSPSVSTREAPANPWTLHRKIAMWSLIGTWGVTTVGAIAMGDAFWATTSLPIVGPWVTYARVASDPTASFQPGGQALLIASGVVQAGLAAYLVTSIVGEANYKPLPVAVLPGAAGAPAGVTVAMAF